MEEIWCDISDYKGLYQVSTLGRVRSLDRIIYDQGRHWFQNGKILKASSQKSGYLFVTLSKAGKTKQYRVHRLVAQTFIPNPILIFNMAIRGMNGVAVQCNSLSREAKEAYFIRNDSDNFLGFSKVIKLPHTKDVGQELHINKWVTQFSKG